MNPTPMLDFISDEELKQKILDARQRIPKGVNHIQLKVDAYNKTEGSMKYIDCPVCKNKGLIAVINAEGEEVIKECSCMKKRRLFRNLESSGLKGVYERYKLENYIADADWQQAVLAKTKAYMEDIIAGKSYWLYVGGQRGSGKSHICTAVSGRLIAHGLIAQFYLWQDIVSGYRATTYRESDRQKLLSNLFGAVDVLYIDDFLKVRAKNDIDLNYDIAFQVLNARYNSRQPVIISSELTITDLAKEDSALSGRITEMANNGEYVLNIERSPEKDMRNKKKTDKE